MTRLGFIWAKLLRREGDLADLSDTFDNLKKDIDGKSVAIIGNARSMQLAKNGIRIDSADVIIRINSAPIPSEVSHGQRTDWHALAIRNSASLRSRIKPSRYLWMSHKRKRLDWKTASSSGFFLFSPSDFKRLSDNIGSRPSTGLMLIDLIERSTAKHVELFGFDFFASLSLTGSRTADQVPHDFEAEKQWVRRLLDRDKRFVLIDDA